MCMYVCVYVTLRTALSFIKQQHICYSFVLVLKLYFKTRTTVKLVEIRWFICLIAKQLYQFSGQLQFKSYRNSPRSLVCSWCQPLQCNVKKLLCFVTFRFLQRADPPSRTVPPSVVCLSTISKLQQSGDLGSNRAIAPQKMKIYKVVLLQYKVVLLQYKVVLL